MNYMRPYTPKGVKTRKLPISVNNNKFSEKTNKQQKGEKLLYRLQVHSGRRRHDRVV